MIFLSEPLKDGEPGPSCNVCGAIMSRVDDSRKFPEQEQRVETGVVRFGDDWPGIFIRGDRASTTGANLEAICGLLEKTKGLPEFEISKMRNLARLLKSCNMHDFNWRCLSCGASTGVR